MSVCVCVCPPPRLLITSGVMWCDIRRVHTNPLKYALDQIASSRVEPIRIRSVHTLFTESEFDYGLPKIYCEAHNNMKIYLEIYVI